MRLNLEEWDELGSSSGIKATPNALEFQLGAPSQLLAAALTLPVAGPHPSRDPEKQIQENGEYWPQSCGTLLVRVKAGERIELQNPTTGHSPRRRRLLL